MIAKGEQAKIVVSANRGTCLIILEVISHAGSIDLFHRKPMTYKKRKADGETKNERE